MFLYGWVIQDEKPLKWATIEIWQGEEMIYQTLTNRWGQFSMEMPLYNEYVFHFSYPGLITKKVLVNTHLPEGSSAFDFHVFDFEVEIYEPFIWLHEEFFDKPVAIVFYDTYERIFDYDRQMLHIYNTRLEYMKAGRADWATAPIPELSLRRGEQAGRTEITDATPPQEDTPAVGAIEEETALPVAEYPEEAALAATDSPEETARPEPAKETPVRVALAQTPEILSVEPPADFPQGVFFSVQVLATARAVPHNFWKPLENNLPVLDIHTYKDNDELMKYTVGTFRTLEETMKHHRLLRNLNYDTYIVAFDNGQRVRVKEALALQ